MAQVVPENIINKKGFQRFWALKAFFMVSPNDGGET